MRWWLNWLLTLSLNNAMMDPSHDSHPTGWPLVRGAHHTCVYVTRDVTRDINTGINIPFSAQSQRSRPSHTWKHDLLGNWWLKAYHYRMSLWKSLTVSQSLDTPTTRELRGSWYLKQVSRSQDRGRLISIFSAFHIPLLPQNKNWFPAPAALPRAQITAGPPGDARAAESFGWIPIPRLIRQTQQSALLCSVQVQTPVRWHVSCSAPPETGDRGKHYKEPREIRREWRSRYFDHNCQNVWEVSFEHLHFRSRLRREQKWIKRTLKSVTREISNRRIWSLIFCRLWTKQRAATHGDRNWVKSTKIGPGGWTMTSWMGTKIKTITDRVTFPQWRLLSRYPRAREWPGAPSWPMSRQSALSSLHPPAWRADSTLSAASRMTRSQLRIQKQKMELNSTSLVKGLTKVIRTVIKILWGSNLFISNIFITEELFRKCN